MIDEQVRMLRDVAGVYKHNGLSLILREAADTIESLYTKLHAESMERSLAYYNGEWIPCSERLPEENGKYLVTYCDDLIENYVIIRNFYNGRFEPMPYSEEHTGRKALAWQPLPEPYKPRNQNQNLKRK